jgi:hypothetical protein
MWSDASFCTLPSFRLKPARSEAPGRTPTRGTSHSSKCRYYAAQPLPRGSVLVGQSARGVLLRQVADERESIAVCADVRQAGPAGTRETLTIQTLNEESPGPPPLLYHCASLSACCWVSPTSATPGFALKRQPAACRGQGHGTPLAVLLARPAGGCARALCGALHLQPCFGMQGRRQPAIFPPCVHYPCTARG